MTDLIDGAVFIGTSLDGFIASDNGDLSWLEPEGVDIGDAGYDAFWAGVDAMLVGRATYDVAAGSDSWLYAGKRVLLLSSTADAGADPRVEVVRSLDEAAERLAGVRTYVDGGQVIRAALRAGHVRELTVTTVPVLLGRGIPLFGDLPRLALEHTATRVLPYGYVQSTWRIAG
jgi:dihydrofolate reductase